MASGRTKTWRHHLVSAAGVLAVLLLAALTWQALAGRRPVAASNDGFLIVRFADGRPAGDVRVVALRGEAVRWVRDADERGVVPFKRMGGRVEVVVQFDGRWLYRVSLDLSDSFVDLDLPAAPARAGDGESAPRVVGAWQYESLPADVRAALAAEQR